MDCDHNSPGNESVDDVKLAELYTTAGVYYATVMIAVVFAQFSVLGFLRGKYSLFFLQSSEVFSILVLVFLYFMILAAGWYFADRFLKFSELLDRIIVNSSDPTLKKLAVDVGQPHLDNRKRIVRYRRHVLAAYVVASVFALAAVLCIA
jgi:hypothetical protein